jgi:arginine deiminase
VCKANEKLAQVSTATDAVKKTAGGLVEYVEDSAKMHIDNVITFCDNVLKSPTVVDIKDTIVKTSEKIQPVVIKTLVASKPYVKEAIQISHPYVAKTTPYVEKYVLPYLDAANKVLELFICLLPRLNRVYSDSY